MIGCALAMKQAPVSPSSPTKAAAELVFDVPVVPVDRLHGWLGTGPVIDYPEGSRCKSLTTWRMEEDDAPILRYLYRHFRPGRHLEFGTWEGAGTLFVLEECDATVWTINLLEGESNDQGQWAYTSVMAPPPETAGWARRRPHGHWLRRIIKPDRAFAYQTDARGFIGRRFLDRGLGHRVCQIYSDSRAWDTSKYPPGFFDSCLVDGGHRADVVESDTRNAVKLVRPGGLVMWHDFCPVRQVVEEQPVTREVVGALRSMFGWLQIQMDDLAWVEPSHLLIGRRAASPASASEAAP